MTMESRINKICNMHEIGKTPLFYYSTSYIYIFNINNNSLEYNKAMNM